MYKCKCLLLSDNSHLFFRALYLKQQVVQFAEYLTWTMRLFTPRTFSTEFHSSSSQMTLMPARNCSNRSTDCRADAFWCGCISASLSVVKETIFRSWKIANLCKLCRKAFGWKIIFFVIIIIFQLFRGFAYSDFMFNAHTEGSWPTPADVISIEFPYFFEFHSSKYFLFP